VTEESLSEEKLRKIIREEIRNVMENESTSSISESEEKSDLVTRRKFLKLAGLGAGGLAFSSLGTSWVSINQQHGSGTSTLSEVLSKGNNVDGQNITDNGTTIWDAANQYVPSSSLESHSHSGDELSPSKISGSITSRSNGITSIDSNFYKSASQPSSPVKGDQWVDTSEQKHKIYTGSYWLDVANIATSLNEDFEDGQINVSSASNWSNPNQLSTTTNALSGSHSLKTDSTIDSYIEIDLRPGEVEFLWRGDVTATQSGGAGSIDILIENAEGKKIASIETHLDDTPEGSDAVYQPRVNGNNVMGGDGTAYLVKFDFDWDAGVFDFYVDGTLQLSGLSLGAGYTSPWRFHVFIQSNNGNSSYMRFDDFNFTYDPQ
jgi:hypothetical protein